MENTLQKKEQTPKTLDSSRLESLISALDHLYQEGNALYLHIPIHTEQKNCDYHLLYDGLNFKMYMNKENKSPVSFYFSGDLGVLCCQDKVMTEKIQAQFNEIILSDLLHALKNRNFTKEHYSAVKCPDQEK